VKDGIELRRRLASSRAAPLAALPVRLGTVARHNSRMLRRSARWLVRSREHTNYTYDLTEISRAHLAWFVAAVAGRPVAEIRSYLDEIERDDVLRLHVRRATQASDRRGLADLTVRYGRRAGWYAFVRALRPTHVVETGTDKGLGSCVLAAALLRNGSGRLTTIDLNPEAGYLIRGPYQEVATMRIGDSLAVLRDLGRPVELFLHDSDHSPGHEAGEFVTVEPWLTDRALVLTDNAEVTDELARWSESRGRRALFFDERPADHWYPGGGIGASYR
jgi:predicted O-methyltransferase YrrM